MKLVLDMLKITVVIILAITGIIESVGCGSPNKDEPVKVEAKFVLPYPVGTSYLCSEIFNSGSHTGSFHYSVDFLMPIGTIVTAARSGQVVYILQSYTDSDPTSGHENVVIIRHDDSTFSRYAHVKQNGVLVSIGRKVSAGDTIALSGNSGSSASAHLHFDVTNSNNGREDQTIPFDFKNTIQHPAGLERWVRYPAYAY